MSAWELLVAAEGIITGDVLNVDFEGEEREYILCGYTGENESIVILKNKVNLKRVFSTETLEEVEGYGLIIGKIS